MSLASKLNYLIETKNAIKNALINKGQTVSDSDTFRSYADKIANIETGIDTSDATASAADMRSGKTAYINGEKITGEVVDLADKELGGTSKGYVDGRDVNLELTFNKNAMIDAGESIIVWHSPAPDSNIITKFITNITFEGDGDSSDYNTDFGVQIGYISNTAIVFMMRGGSSASYEHLYMELKSAPDGVTCDDKETTNFWYDNDDTLDSKGYLFAMIIRGFDATKTYSITVNAGQEYDGGQDCVYPHVYITEN